MAGVGGNDLEAGSSRRHAIVVSNVLDEYDWLREHFPGYRVTLQTLCLDVDGLYDVLQIESESGDARELYFALGRRSRRRD
ncbi:MAG: hypothetical protein IPK27_05655 [Rhodanobacteraceae bacterium]|nr:hypothetical protein [Rhodanobacteraceae bacterium]